MIVANILRMSDSGRMKTLNIINRTETAMSDEGFEALCRDLMGKDAVMGSGVKVIVTFINGSKVDGFVSTVRPPSTVVVTQHRVLRNVDPHVTLNPALIQEISITSPFERTYT